MPQRLAVSTEQLCPLLDKFATTKVALLGGGRNKIHRPARPVVMSASVATDCGPISGQHALKPSPGREAFPFPETGACVQAQNAGRVQPRLRQPWSGASVSTLLSDYPTAIPVVDIADRLGRSKGSIYGKARRLRLRRPARKEKHTEPAAVLDLPPCATADEIRARMTLADDPIVVTEPIVIAGGEPTPEPPSLPDGPAAHKDAEAPRPYVMTPLEGRQCVWFPDLVERMMRLWLANVNHHVIAAVLGRGITGKAVQSKAQRVGMLPRHGLILIRDIEIAGKIDREAAPLPGVIRDHHNKPRHLRRCGMAGVACYMPPKMRFSPQAKETKTYQGAMSAML